MPNYAICRIKKANTPAQVKIMKRHNERDNDVPNADPKVENISLLPIGESTDLYQNVMDMIPEKRRSNAVLAVEHVMTASSEFFEDMNRSDILRWSQQSHNFLVQKYGEDRIAYSTLHLDEKTPHVHSVIVPLEMEEIKDPDTGKITLDSSVVKDKLNARQIFGGREKMIQLQDEYHKCVESFGLDRGIKGSTAKHIDIKKFYSALQDENLVKTIDEKKPVRQGPLDLTFEKRLIEHYRNEVLYLAKLNIKALDDITENSTTPLKENIDGLNINIDELKKENELAKNRMRKLEKSLSKSNDLTNDYEKLTSRQVKYMENVAEHFSKHWNRSKDSILKDFNKYDKMIEDEKIIVPKKDVIAKKEIKPKQSKGMSMNM